ncbi:MAG: M3 family metallopeptidase [Alphaproteobacteria bacterium]|nr:M3 family metallopeptidase [Alphaproteobacteria bacterium]
MNPLLDFSGLPRFDAILPEHVEEAMTQLIQDAENALETVIQADFPAQWTALAACLDASTERLGRAWGAVGHLHAVADTPELRAAYTAALPRVTEFFTRLGADERLYAKYKAIVRSTLNPEQSRAHENALRNFVLSGAELTGGRKERFAAIQERQAELSQQFSEHVLDSTDRWQLRVDASRLKGLPQDVLAATRQAAQDKGMDGHMLSLKMPCYLPIMQYALDRELRHEIYRAYATRASDLGSEPALDNTALIAEIVALRQEEAQLLGYDNAAQVSLATKMAPSPEHVMAFLRDLAQRARPHAEHDVADMRAFAAEHLNLKDPQPWDWTFISERLKEARYAFSESELKTYFPAPKVLAGLFKIVETLFEVSIRRDAAPTWHPAVEFYRIERAGQLLGQFYLDPPARTGKRGGAWMDDVRARWLRPDDGQLQTPIAHMVCNFAEGVAGQPPLLTHDDVITLFHEFGHGLHHMLTQINERDVSGISGVEWDAVELPSQFMENFCWEWTVLRHMTAHVETGEPLPRALFDKMVAAKNFQSGLQTLRQVEFALFDMRLHAEPGQGPNALALLQEVRDEVAVLPAPEFSRMPHSFSHVFAGGYSAGYYSYKWAEVLSADAYAAFEETTGTDGSPSLETGRRYREAILEAGGSRPALESFKAFRGREPSIDALLRHQGMA